MREGLPPMLSLRQVQRRVARERRARREAEFLLGSKSGALLSANEDLRRLTADLRARAEEAEAERARALTLGRTDPLTGLPNRGAFSQALAARIVAAECAGTGVVLHIIDLDCFKEVNDAHGHDVGDALLHEIGRRLAALAGPDDTVARLGGDEFAVISCRPEPDRAMARRIVEALTRPIVFGGCAIRPAGSVGVAAYPHDVADPANLQRCADLALARAKAACGSGYAAFDTDLRAETDARRILAADLRVALTTGQIEPWFQPVVDATTGTILSLEVLARWHHPERGMIGPNVFIPIAEATGMIREIDETVFNQACARAAAWVEKGWIESIACNVSPRDLLDPDFSTALIERLRRTTLPPTALTVEITETFLMKDMSLARRHIAQLSEHGVRVALDDFGTGYSNLGALLELPIHTLKLDRSLIVGLGKNPKADGLVRLLVQTTQVLGVDLVAEGIEDEIQAIQLRAAGCRKMQGFLFARPAPADAVAARLSAAAEPASTSDQDRDRTADLAHAVSA